MAQRLFGTLLSWLNDKSSDIFVIATANNISQLPPEFSRAERFDGVFFIDLPTPAEREAIWKMHLREFDVSAEEARPSDGGWTGAEIRSCCRLAALLEISLVEAGQHVVPVSITAAESIEQLRRWADGRCLSADRGGIFRREAPKRTSRKSLPSPEMN